MDFSAYSVFQEEEVIKEEEEVDFRKEIEIALNQRDSEMRDLIGSGGFANVYTIWNRKYQQMFCAKVIKLKNQSETHKIAIENEIQTLVKVVHKNIICIFDHFKSENCYYLILEYCPNGSLEDVIKKHGGLPLYDFVVLSRQLLNAIAYCHSIGIAHRDFKPTNILFDAHNRPKLADFGLAQFFEKNKFETRKFGGSLAYMAPELALKQDFSPMAVDIWALGVTLFQMATGHLPWTSEDIALEITNGYLMYPNTIPNLILQVLKKMLNITPSLREPIENILKLPLYTTIPEKGNIKSSNSANQSLGRHITPNKSNFEYLAENDMSQIARNGLSLAFSKRRPTSIGLLTKSQSNFLQHLNF